jgi:heme/copper-type cytochrome/quinol oxidase subunit 2
MKRIALLLFMFFTHFAHAQCAMCRAVVESGSPSEAEGLNTGILYLMIFPYVLIGTLFFFIIRYRITKKKKEEI